MSNLPSVLPPDFGAAFGALLARPHLEVDDLELLVLLECAGDGLYQSLADRVPLPEAAELLRQNGREETAHAHRLKKAIELLSGESYEIPGLDENPYATPPELPAVDAALLESVRATEFAGDAQYQVWASNEPNADVAELLRQNGREETRHGERVGRVIELLGGGAAPAG